jgi:hypothetical protein
MAIRFIPFGAWPAERPRTKSRKHSPSKLTSARLLREIEDELTRIGGKDGSVEVAMTANELRRNGLMYAGKAPRDPGIILRFSDRVGRSIVMPSDRYTTVEGNLFGVYKTLEALRTVDRHGCALSGEQYTGWARLPSGEQGGTAPMSLDDACETIVREVEGDALDADQVREIGQIMQASAGTITRMYVRKGRQLAHPDSGGSNFRFQRIQEAVAVLSAHIGEDI